MEDPGRFRRSRNVAACFGLTSKRWQSGSSVDIRGRISKAGDPDVRVALYEAGSALLTRVKGTDTIKSWGRKLAKKNFIRRHRGRPQLAVVMHAMWRDGTVYVGDPQARAQDADTWRTAKVQRLARANS